MIHFASSLLFVQLVRQQKLLAHTQNFDISSSFDFLTSPRFDSLHNKPFKKYWNLSTFNQHCTFWGFQSFYNRNYYHFVAQSKRYLYRYVIVVVNLLGFVFCTDSIDLRKDNKACGSYRLFCRFGYSTRIVRFDCFRETFFLLIIFAKYRLLISSLSARNLFLV